MRAHKWMVLLGIMLLLFFGLGSATAQDSSPVEPQATVGPNFTYQGYLEDNNLPANGKYDFEVKLYDAVSAGVQVGSTASLGDVDVVKGYFTVQPDFVNYFTYIYTGQALWLEISVRPGASNGSFTTLTPRQPLTATPYALSLVPGATIDVEYNFGGRGIINVTNRSTGFDTFGVYARSYSTLSGGGVIGLSSATTGDGYGVFGSTSAEQGTGVRGESVSTAGVNYGVYGKNQSSSGYGVYGYAVSTNGIPVVGMQTAGSVVGDWSNWKPGGLFGGRNGVVGFTETAGGYGAVGRSMINDGNSYGVYAFSDNSSTTGTDKSYGVYGYSHTTALSYAVYGDTTRSDHLYGLYTPDNSYSANYVTTGAMMYVVQNGGSVALEPGDVVAFIGIGNNLANTDQPTIQVARADLASGTAVAGVVYSRYNINIMQEVDPEAQQREGKSPESSDAEFTSEGPIGPGEYLLIVVEGLTQMKTSVLSGEVNVGDLLSVGSTAGTAVKASQADVNGAIFAKALEPIVAGDKLIYVYVYPVIGCEP
jgi:hypothetical protein